MTFTAAGHQGVIKMFGFTLEELSRRPSLYVKSKKKQKFKSSKVSCVSFPFLSLKFYSVYFPSQSSFSKSDLGFKINNLSYLHFFGGLLDYLLPFLFYPLLFSFTPSTLPSNCLCLSALLTCGTKDKC